MATTAEAVAFEAALDTFLATCRVDPLRYTLAMWPWGEPGPLEHEIGPEDWQREVLEAIGSAVRERAFDGQTPVLPVKFAISSGHGSGKTALLAWLIHWLMDTRPECKTRVTANTSTQLEDATWATILSWGATKLTAPRWVMNSSGMYVEGDRANWFARPVTCKEENAQAFAGLHNRRSATVFGFDEGSTIPEGVYQVAMGGLTDGEPFVFCFGNMTRRTGQLYRAVFGSERDHWLRRVIDCEQIQFHNPARRAVNQRLYAEWKQTYGEDSDYVRVRIHGLPPNADELQFVDHARVQAAQTNPVQVVTGEPLICGVDVSGGGSSWTVCRFRRGFDARSLPPVRLTGEQTTRDDRQQVVGTLAEILSDTREGRRVAAMFVDSAYGAPIVVRLRQLGYTNVFEVNFGGESRDPVHSKNLRAFMWQAMKDWLPHAAIDAHDQRLQDDLEGPGFHLNLKNQLVIESKDEMQKRGIASPDDADALALTWAQPVAPPQRRRPQWLPEPPAWSG